MAPIRSEDTLGRFAVLDLSAARASSGTKNGVRLRYSVNTVTARRETGTTRMRTWSST